MNPSLTINSKFYPALLTQKRYILLYGGRGSGKSYFVPQKFVMMARQKKYFRGYLMREISGDIRNSQFQEIKDLLTDTGLEDEFHIRESTMEFQHKVTGHKILSKGFKKSAGNQTAKVKSIKDPTHIWIEEADEIEEEDFIKADTSIRTTKSDYVQIILTFNPENEESWINKRWFVNNQPVEDEDSLIIHSTYRDNIQNLQSSYIKTLDKLRTTNPEYAKVYVEGNWGGGVKGKIFTHFQKIDRMPDLQPFYGLDFGYTNDPTAFTQLMHHNNRLYIRQLIYQTQLTNPELFKLIKSFGLHHFDRIYADSAEPKSIAELRKMGLNVIPATKGPGSINTGIDKIKSMEVFMTEDSTDIWKETKYYQWHVNKDGVVTNQPVDFMNHGMDSIRYGITSLNRKDIQLEYHN